MKKKVLVWGFLVLVLFLTTACGSNKTNEEEDDSSKNTELKETTDNEEKDSSKEVVKIEEVVCQFRDGLAVVNNDNGSYVIDEEGYEKFKLEVDTGSFSGNDVKVANGYVTVVKNDKEAQVYTSSIYDENGELIKSEENTIYGEVSSSGYVFVKRIEKSLSGESETMAIEDLKGNVIKEAKLNEYGNLFDHYDYIINDVFLNGDELINIKTGKTQSTNTSIFDNSTEVYDDMIIRGGKVYSLDLSSVYDYNGEKLLSKDFYYKENGIYEVVSGKLLKDLSEGGVESIYYYDGVFYVYSDTGYIYTMDTNFNYIKSPVERKSIELLGVSSSGVILGSIESKVKVSIIDKNFEDVKVLDMAGYPDEVKDNFFYGNAGYDYIFNIKLNKDL